MTGAAPRDMVAGEAGVVLDLLIAASEPARLAEADGVSHPPDQSVITITVKMAHQTMATKCQ